MENDFSEINNHLQDINDTLENTQDQQNKESVKNKIQKPDKDMKFQSLDFSGTMGAIKDLPATMVGLVLNDFNTPLISMIADQSGKIFGDLKQVFKKPIKAELEQEEDIYAEQMTERQVTAVEDGNELLVNQNGLLTDLISILLTTPS